MKNIIKNIFIINFIFVIITFITDISILKASEYANCTTGEGTKWGPVAKKCQDCIHNSFDAESKIYFSTEHNKNLAACTGFGEYKLNYRKMINPGTTKAYPTWVSQETISSSAPLGETVTISAIDPGVNNVVMYWHMAWVGRRQEVDGTCRLEKKNWNPNATVIAQVGGRPYYGAISASTHTVMLVPGAVATITSPGSHPACVTVTRTPNYPASASLQSVSDMNVGCSAANLSGEANSLCETCRLLKPLPEPQSPFCDESSQRLLKQGNSIMDVSFPEETQPIKATLKVIAPTEAINELAAISVGGLFSCNHRPKKWFTSMKIEQFDEAGKMISRKTGDTLDFSVNNPSHSRLRVSTNGTKNLCVQVSTEPQPEPGTEPADITSTKNQEKICEELTNKIARLKSEIETGEGNVKSAKEAYDTAKKVLDDDLTYKGPAREGKNAQRKILRKAVQDAYDNFMAIEKGISDAKYTLERSISTYKKTKCKDKEQEEVGPPVVQGIEFE